MLDPVGKYVPKISYSISSISSSILFLELTPYGMLYLFPFSIVFREDPLKWLF